MQLLVTILSHKHRETSKGVMALTASANGRPESKHCNHSMREGRKQRESGSGSGGTSKENVAVCCKESKGGNCTLLIRYPILQVKRISSNAFKPSDMYGF